jgi:hypothetical protein
VIHAERTILVLSDAYLEALFTQPEWASGFRFDPKGDKRRLIPVRIRHCERAGGMLDSLIYIDVVDCDEMEASRRLLGGVREGRAKPSLRPRFPGRAIGAAAPLKACLTRAREIVRREA